MRSPADDDQSESPIELYLDELVVALTPHRPRALRHLLAEAEAHLRDDAAHAVAAGLSPREAETQAVERFGPAADVAAAERSRLVTPLPVVARQLLMTALLLGGIGAVAVGVSGLVAELVRLLAGAQVLVAPRPGTALAAADCARWLAADPGAHTCRDAAVADWVDEVVGYRIAMGALGLVALGAFAWLRRRSPGSSGWTTLPSTVGNTLALTGFAVAGLWTLGLGIDLVVVDSGNGSGQWLSAAPVALVAAAVFGVRLVRDLRSDVVLTPAPGHLGGAGTALRAR